MTTKNKPVRKKPKSVTPIVFKISKEKQDAIKKPPRTSLRRFIEGNADANDWYNIAFRLRVGVYIAISEYTEETVDGLKSAFGLCDAIHTNAKKETGPDWTITKDQIDILQDALDAVDVMQDETTRRVQLDAHHAAQKLMKRYAIQFDEYLLKLKKCSIEN